MKKFFDFEIITIMVLAILLGPIYGVYFAVPEIQIELNTKYEISTNMLINIGIGIFALVNLVYIVIKSIGVLHDYSDVKAYRRHKKIVGQIDEIDVSKYDFILGSFIYYRCFAMNKLINSYKKYYTEKGYLVNGSIEENCVDKLSEIEKGIILMCADDVKLEENDPMNLEGRCINDLKEKKFLKHDTLGRSLEKFCEGKDGKYINTPYDKNPRIFILAILFFIVSGIIMKIFGVYETFIITPFIVVIMVFNWHKISLTELGKFERIRIINLIEKLKKQDDLSEKEKLFLEIMSK